MFILFNRKSPSVKKVIIWFSILFLVLILGLASILLIKHLKSSPSYVPKGIKIEGILLGGLSKEAAKTKLLEISKSTVKWPKDPAYELGYFTEGKAGRILSIDQTLDKIHEAPMNTNVRPVYFNILPVNNVKDLQKIKFGMGTDKEFHFLDDIELKELKNIFSDLFNTVIYPGETFSLADYCQSINFENKDINSKLSQLVARTLYKTAKNAKLEIVEGWLVPQPKLGSLYEDNIGFLPGRDLKFRNTSPSPILIRGEVDKESIKIWFLGS